MAKDIMVNALSMYAEKKYAIDAKMLSIGELYGRDVAIITANILHRMDAKLSPIRRSYIVKFRYNDVDIRISYYMNIDSEWYSANYEAFIGYSVRTIGDFWKNLGPALDNAEFV